MSEFKKGCNKVSVIGAGNVGATLAMRIIEADLADVAMVDIAGDLARGKACDMQDAAAIIGHERHITGGDNYDDIKDSDIVVVTAGLARKPGMSREELLGKNAAIVKSASENIVKFAPKATVIVVTNPLDVMTYIALKATGFDPARVIGMAGVLDSSRCDNQVASELNIDRAEVNTVVLGSHGDSMVPLMEESRAQGRPLKDILSNEQSEEIIKRTKGRGAEIVTFLKSGSAYFAPSAACFSMIKAILGNEGVTLCVSAYLNGQYGLKGICIGVPCVLGANGIERIIEMDLSDKERSEFQRSADTIASNIRSLTVPA